MQVCHYSPRTVDAYVRWIRRFILFHGKRHPDQMGEPEVAAFLSDLASNRGMSASTQNQALAALLFLYSDVLARDLEELQGVVHAKRPSRLPMIYTHVLNKGGFGVHSPLDAMVAHRALR